MTAMTVLLSEVAPVCRPNCCAISEQTLYLLTQLFAAAHRARRYTEKLSTISARLCRRNRAVVAWVGNVVSR